MTPAPEQTAHTGGRENGTGRLKQDVVVSWNHDHQTWIAIDKMRPGICGVHTNKSKVRGELRQAQIAYDERD